MELKILIILISIALVANAHGVGGGEDKSVNGYRVDFSYDTFSPTVGERILMGFGLTNETTGNPVSYSSVWTRISKGGELLFSTGIAHDFGGSGLSYTFAEPGEYRIQTDFYDGVKKLIGTEFSVNVTSSDNVKSTSGIGSDFTILLLAFAAGAIASWLLLMFRRKTTTQRRKR